VQIDAAFVYPTGDLKMESSIVGGLLVAWLLIAPIAIAYMSLSATNKV